MFDNEIVKKLKQEGAFDKSVNKLLKEQSDNKQKRPAVSRIKADMFEKVSNEPEDEVAQNEDIEVSLKEAEDTYGPLLDEFETWRADQHKEETTASFLEFLSQKEDMRDSMKILAYNKFKQQLNKSASEAKVNEEEKGTYRVVAKSITDKNVADKIAQDAKGRVVADVDDEKKFMVLVGESKVEENKTEKKYFAHISEKYEELKDRLSVIDAAHNMDNVIAIWWYRVSDGFLEIQKNVTTHADKKFDLLKTETADLEKGRLLKYKGDNILMIYSTGFRKTSLSEDQLEDLVKKMSKECGCHICCVINDKGENLYEKKDPQVKYPVEESKDKNLPKETSVPRDVVDAYFIGEDEEAVTDYLSNKYGWLIKSLSVHPDGSVTDIEWDLDESNMTSGDRNVWGETPAQARKRRSKEVNAWRVTYVKNGTKENAVFDDKGSAEAFIKKMKGQEGIENLNIVEESKVKNIVELAQRLCVIKRLKEKNSLKEAEERFIKETEQIELKEEDRQKVYKLFKSMSEQKFMEETDKLKELLSGYIDERALASVDWTEAEQEMQWIMEEIVGLAYDLEKKSFAGSNSKENVEEAKQQKWDGATDSGSIYFMLRQENPENGFTGMSHQDAVAYIEASDEETAKRIIDKYRIKENVSAIRLGSELLTSSELKQIAKGVEDVNQFIEELGIEDADEKDRMREWWKSNMMKYDIEKKAFVKIGEGRGTGLSPADVDREELRMGLTVEFEHIGDGTDPAQEDVDAFLDGKYEGWTPEKLEMFNESMRIAMDHLAELPDYYTRLNKMEEEGKNEVVDQQD